MAHFTGTTALLKGTGEAPKNKVILNPTQTDFAEHVSGTVLADQPGTLEVQQTFDLVTFAGTLTILEWAETAHWDSVEKIAVEAKVPKTFFINIVAPYFRLVFTNTSATAQTEFRLYARVFESGRI